mgnify:CR=1 FL=1
MTEARKRRAGAEDAAEQARAARAKLPQIMADKSTDSRHLAWQVKDAKALDAIAKALASAARAAEGIKRRETIRQSYAAVGWDHKRLLDK